MFAVRSTRRPNVMAVCWKQGINFGKGQAWRDIAIEVVPVQLKLPWEPGDSNDPGIPRLSQEEALEAMAAIRTRSQAGFMMRKAAIAFDPLEAARDRIDALQWPFEIVRAAYGPFGTSHLPERHREYFMKYSRWSEGVTLSEQRVHFDLHGMGAVVFGRG